MPWPSLLQQLPQELQLKVVSLLDYGSILGLLQTNQHFHQLIDPKDISSEEKGRFIRTAEQFTRHANNYGCFRCFRVKPVSDFTDKQIKASRGKGNSKSGLRFCYDCGIRHKLFTPGNIIRRGGVERIFCLRCVRVKDGQFCNFCECCLECLQHMTGNPVEQNSAARDIGDIMSMLSILPASSLRVRGADMRLFEGRRNVGTEITT